jgi:hypothetical protein
MRFAQRTAHGIRLAALLAAGAFALHQLRYLIAFGASASGEPVAPGHGYMTDLLVPIAVLALAAALATLIRGTEAAPAIRASLARRAAIFAAALLAIYGCQESLEILATGHGFGFDTLVAAGGWIALPLALGIGALSAVIARALEGVERAIAVAHAVRRRRRPPAVRGRALPARASALAAAPLAFGLARRPPPFALA